MKFYKQSPNYDSILDILNLIFTAVFALEFVFKLAAFRFKVQIWFKIIKFTETHKKNRFFELIESLI